MSPSTPGTAPSTTRRAIPAIARFAWLPSPWLLSLWTLWWLWRYGAVQALPGYGELGWQSAAGYLVDALLLDALLALLRWRAGDGELRGAARVERADPLGPRWLRYGAIGLLAASALARGVDGLHCYLAHAHMDAAFWRTLAEPGRLWALRYVWVAVVVTALVARVLVLRELGRAARVRVVLAADGEGLRRFVHRDAMRAAFSGCLGGWLGVVAGGPARALVAPAEWWALGGLVELVFG